LNHCFTTARAVGLISTAMYTLIGMFSLCRATAAEGIYLVDYYYRTYLHRYHQREIRQ
jgi:hypothetical protein